MKTVWERFGRLVRGARACRGLEYFGIDARRYWLLMDLFDSLSERGEMLDQLGRDGIALKTSAWLYAGIAALVSVALLLQRVDSGVYLRMFVILTAFILTVVLMSETGNSLVNPVEGLVLAHQPIDGATYTAAKLSHLLRIVFYLVVGLDAIPAVAALLLPHVRWWYPALHLVAAFATGFLAASLCCALFGWLMRFVPVKRLRAAGQIAGTLPFLGAFGWQYVQMLLKKLSKVRWLPTAPGVRGAILAAAVAAAIAIVALGLRSLSADYLVRVSIMMHGGSKAVRPLRRRALFGGLVSRFFGGAPARAGFAYTRILMLRDWQFRRQVLPLCIMIPLSFGPVLLQFWRADPFGGKFSAMHLLPHVLGIVLAMVCNLLPYGADHKGVWVFLLAPDGSLRRFARGVYALLWIGPVGIPHVLLFPLLAWAWGVSHAFLFLAYSLAASSVYAALVLRLVEGVPFSKQVDPSRGALMLPTMIVGSLCIAIAVGLQWLLFHSAAAVVGATILVTGAAWFLTRSSLEAFAISIRYNLGISTTESTAFYTEVDA